MLWYLKLWAAIEWSLLFNKSSLFSKVWLIGSRPLMSDVNNGGLLGMANHFHTIIWKIKAENKENVQT